MMPFQSPLYRLTRRPPAAFPATLHALPSWTNRVRPSSGRPPGPRAPGTPGAAAAPQPGDGPQRWPTAPARPRPRHFLRRARAGGQALPAAGPTAELRGGRAQRYPVEPAGKAAPSPGTLPPPALLHRPPSAGAALGWLPIHPTRAARPTLRGMSHQLHGRGSVN